jgi:hypothetical protein
MNAMLFGLAWTYGTPFALYVFACLMRACFPVSRATEANVSALEVHPSELMGEIERLQTENWQLKQACGYPIPADKETISQP